MSQKQPTTEESGSQIVPAEIIVNKIYVLRGRKVMLDSDLADLYQVQAKELNRQVRRNINRFPSDFMFQLALEEASNLRSQIVISSSSYGGRRYLPLAFTEQGVAMLSSVLHSKRAVQVNIAIMRAFVKLREILSTNKELTEKLKEMERRYDQKFFKIFTALNLLMAPDNPSEKSRIGFTENKLRHI